MSLGVAALTTVTSVAGGSPPIPVNSRPRRLPETPRNRTSSDGQGSNYQTPERMWNESTDKPNSTRSSAAPTSEPRYRSYSDEEYHRSIYRQSSSRDPPPSRPGQPFVQISQAKAQNFCTRDDLLSSVRIIASNITPAPPSIQG